jgi:hypothetical protein
MPEDHTQLAVRLGRESSAGLAQHAGIVNPVSVTTRSRECKSAYLTITTPVWAWPFVPDTCTVYSYLPGWLSFIGPLSPT